VVAEIACGDNPKRADRGQPPGVGAAQAVITVAVSHNLAVAIVRQVELAHEGITRISPVVSISPVTIPIEPSAVVIPVSWVPIQLAISRAVRTRITTGREPVTIAAITPVVVVPVSRIVAPARIIKHGDLPF
jgi:hypothetical protein